MRLAWFRPGALERAAPLDDTAPLITTLRSTHDIEVVTRADAHDFVWKHFRAPYELCVFELDNDATYAYVWPYLLQYSGLLLLRSLTLHDSRAHALVRARRPDDYAAEFAFSEGHSPLRASDPTVVVEGTWPMLRVPLMAARLVVLPHRGIVEALQQQYPNARLVFAPLGGAPVPGAKDVQRRPPGRDSSVVFGTVAADRPDVVHRALARARESGAPATLLVDPSPGRVLQEADVIVTLRWPACGQPETLAMAAMAAAKPLIVLETEFTADWPALNPQTWQPRGLPGDAPVAVSIDLRDEEHSLVVAVRRLSLEAPLRARLGEAAYAWWRAHGAIRRAAEAWDGVLREAAPLDPPARPQDWPAHLNADGTQRARAILAECGATVDLF